MIALSLKFFCHVSDISHFSYLLRSVIDTVSYLFYLHNYCIIFHKIYVNYCRCSFYLQACEGSTVQILTQGKLSAPRILRIHKVSFSFGFASLKKGGVFSFCFWVKYIYFTFCMNSMLLDFV